MPWRMWRLIGGVSVAAAAAAAVPSDADASKQSRVRAVAHRAVANRALANRCFAIKSIGGARFIAVARGGGAYRASATAIAGAARFYVKPTGLGTYLLYDQGAKLMSVAGKSGSITRVSAAGPRAEWAVGPTASAIRSTLNRRFVSVQAHRARLTLVKPATAGLEFVPALGCTQFPEARVGASRTRFKGTNRDGSVVGFVDAHLHITANMRAGGRVIYGEPFDRFGIAAALGQDAKYHGADGRLDYTGNLLRGGTPTGTHDTQGWPTFNGWPVYNTQTHQQTYYVWLQRAWEAGERLVVAQTVDDQALCLLEPHRNDGCNETRSITAQIRALRGLQDYVDAQHGGRGQGWFRLVYSPAQARRVIERGKLAVIIGIESSDPFGCSEKAGHAQCTRADIDRGLRDYERLGVRGMFVAHWANNAFSGAALEPGTKGIFINILNRLQTGSYFQTLGCPGAGQGVDVVSLPKAILAFLAGFFPAARQVAAEGMPTYPGGLRCNAEGLTPLGRYLVSRMIAQHMLIEVDHLSESARDSVLSIAEPAHYPLISSHNGTGGKWTSAELVRLYRLGGFAAVTPDVAPALATKIIGMSRLQDRRRYSGVGIGSDTGGFALLPGPRADAARHPLRYPFTSFDGRVTFTRERSGTRTFDLNRDGVAHYGLMADLLAEMQRRPGGRRAMSLLFRSAEAYLEMWERAVGHEPIGH